MEASVIEPSSSQLNVKSKRDDTCHCCLNLLPSLSSLS